MKYTRKKEEAVVNTLSKLNTIDVQFYEQCVSQIQELDALIPEIETAYKRIKDLKKLKSKLEKLVSDYYPKEESVEPSVPKKPYRIANKKSVYVQKESTEDIDTVDTQEEYKNLDDFE